MLRFKVVKNSVALSVKTQPIGFTVGKATIIHTQEEYEGDYTVVPKRDEQTLKTAQKVMKADLLVTGIPYYSTSNTSGGETVYIAKEV